ncbi:MAG: LamG-like jellyroll fold domain-containing protein [Candidatus Nanopelagicales bacterium]|nr:LamG-like jellyroll fold domain-containing protein [Candidatus Nanopelagicales bacterium]
MPRDFDGSTQYLENLNAALTAAPATMACWFNRAAVGGGALMGIGSSSVDEYFGINLLSTGKVRACTKSSTGISCSTHDTVLTEGEWGHAAAVFASASSRTAYFNGSAATTSTVSRTPASLDQMRIGAISEKTLGAYFDGLLAHCAIWNVALTAEEIARLALGVHPVQVRPDALVCCPPIWGRTDPEPDIVGGFHMTLVGSPLHHESQPKIFLPSRQKYVPQPSMRPICRHIDVPGQVFNADFHYGVPAFHYKGIKEVNYSIVPLSGTYAGTATATGTQWEEITRLSGQEQPVAPELRTRTSKIHGIGKIDVDISEFSTEGEHSIEIEAIGNDGGRKHKITTGSFPRTNGLYAWTFGVDKGTLESHEAWVETVANGGDDATGEVDNVLKPFATIGKAYEALQTAHSGSKLDYSFILLGAGSHNVKKTTLTSVNTQKFWCSVMPKAGLTKADVTLTTVGGQDRIPDNMKLKLYDLTIKDSAVVVLLPLTAAAWLWMDNCHLERTDANTGDLWTGNGNGDTEIFFTNCTATFCGRSFGDTSMYRVRLIRNCDVWDVTDDLARNCDVVYNIELLSASDPENHIDIVQHSFNAGTRATDDIIHINIRGDDIEGDCVLFTRSTSNPELNKINGWALINSYGGFSTFASRGKTVVSCSQNHFVVAHNTNRTNSTSTNGSTGSFNLGSSTIDVLYRFTNGLITGNHAAAFRLFGKDWSNPTYVYTQNPSNVKYDKNNTYNEGRDLVIDYHDTSTPAIGTNWTKEDPNLDAIGKPLPGSPLLNRITALFPIDLSGLERDAGVDGASAGAYEAGIFISPSAVAVPLSIPAPTVQLTFVVSPSAVAVPLSIPAPAVTITMNPAAVPVAVTAPAPTVSLTITPNAVVIPIAVPAPTTLYSLAPAPVVVTTAIPQPTITTAVTPATLAVAIAAATPAVVATVTPDAVAVPIVTPAVVVAAAVGPAAVQIPIDVPAPAVTVQLSPSAVAIPLAIPTPTIITGIFVTPDPVAVPIETPGVTMTLTTSPGPVAVAVVVPTATLAIALRPDSTITTLSVPAPMVLTGVTPDQIAVAIETPSVNLTLEVSPAVVAIPIVVTAPALTITLQPAPATVPMVVPAPTVLMGIFIVPDAVAVPIGLPAVVATLVVGPDVVQVPINVTTPTLTIALQPEPAIMPLAIPVPTVATGITVAPAAVAIPIVIAAPAVGLGLTPQAVAVPMLVPTPTLTTTLRPDATAVVIVVASPTVTTPGAAPARVFDLTARLNREVNLSAVLHREVELTARLNRVVELKGKT